ncbi:receptor-like protein 34 [Ziziphus jujuba]|uniref:Receptor-like protein 34 n=1 Tax=Ziziphus jujuba TaxID=326968 RepID=A0ABM3ZTW1_ZIZJJ|nr:receptor-like protein 34 [Ziziphus jujuba]
MGFFVMHAMKLLCFLIFFFFLCKPSSSSSVTPSVQPCPRDQSLSLLQFKNMLSISNSTTPECEGRRIRPSPSTENWKEGVDCCSWSGVTCDYETGNVNGLFLSCSFLQGTLHSNYNASLLSHLQRLDLSGNSLNGTIPPWIFGFPSLEILNLENNLFTGNIGKISSFSLKTIGLSDNKLYGPVPKSIFQLENLNNLLLDSNNLSGVVDTDMFSKLKNLQVLDLSVNRFLSLSTINNVNFTLPNLTDVSLSSCSIKEFPPLLKGSKKIHSLDLSNNQIYGPIPQWFYEMGNDSLLFLSLSRNSFTKIEKIPWKNTLQLDLQDNLLEGELPIPPNSTQFLSASKNNLTGQVSLSICRLKDLKILDLSHNNLAGKIPPCLGNISLSVLDLRMNRFQGTIPSDLGTSCTIPADFESGFRSLNLNGNQLEGSLPTSLLNCSGLEVFDVGNNRLHGIFPHWVETLPDLKVFVLRSNSFHGPVRGSFKTNNIFPQLKIFDISRNNFSGPFPTGYIQHFKAMMNMDESEGGRQYIGDQAGFSYNDSLVLAIKGKDIELVRVLTILTTIDLSDNKFQGEIPKAIGELKSLKSLNLSHNNLTGQIPASIGLLENLEGLDLSSNNLSGEIPRELASLTFLSFLNLSWNRLIGEIPQGKQFNTFENDWFQGNLGLCGFPLTRKCADDDDDEGSQPPSLTGFQEEDEMKHESVFNWVAISSGYACGVVYGVVMGYFLLYRRRQRWLLCLYR